MPPTRTEKEAARPTHLFMRIYPYPRSQFATAFAHLRSIGIRCTRTESRACPEPRTHDLDWIKRAVLNMVREELQAPDPSRILEDLPVGRSPPCRLRHQRTCSLGAASGNPRYVDRMDRRCKDAQAAEGTIKTQLAALDARLASYLELRPAALGRFPGQSMNSGALWNAVALAEIARRRSPARTCRPGDRLLSKKGEKSIGHVKGRLATLTRSPDMLLRKLSVGSMVAEEGLEPPTRGL
jgi:hypothetical protein